jgi:hypothetical protein
MIDGLIVAMFAVFITVWIGHTTTITRYDVLVSEIPNIKNFELCESLGTKLQSFDKLTATCEDGFEFDLIKEQGQ